MANMIIMTAKELPGLISSARNVARICDKNLLCARISDEGDRPENSHAMTSQTETFVTLPDFAIHITIKKFVDMTSALKVSFMIFMTL